MDDDQSTALISIALCCSVNSRASHLDMSQKQDKCNDPKIFDSWRVENSGRLVKEVRG